MAGNDIELVRARDEAEHVLDAHGDHLRGGQVRAAAAHCPTVRGARGRGPTWMSGPQSTLSGVVSLWVSERPSVMTRAIRLFGVGGRSRFRVYCSASPVNVPPAIHCSFLMALRGHSTGSVRGGGGARAPAEGGRRPSGTLTP